MNPRIAIYLGGLLGPFGVTVVAAILPELSATYGVSQTSAATSLTAYLLPFALVMLVSGSLGERWGAARTIRIAYAGYAVAALLAAIAPWFWLFQLSRGLQGVCNAFVTPLLLSKLAASAPKARLGRTLGTYGAMQSIGQTSAPLLGGLAAEGAWQWAFVGLAALSVVLATCRLPPDPVRATAAKPPSMRQNVRHPVLFAGAISFVTWASAGGLSFLVAFRLDDAFALSPSARGLALTVFGVAGALGARLTGAMVDRFGSRAMVGSGLLASGLAVASIGLLEWLPPVVLAWAIVGVCGQVILVGVNTTVLTAGTGGGAISVVTALRFLGMSASPAAFTDAYRIDAALGFLLPGALLVLLVPVVATWWPRRNRA